MTHRKIIYLDHNATTPCASEVVEAMLPYFHTHFGNASSVHSMGRRAANSVAEARSLAAETIGAASDEICFTSGATESNNIVVLGLANHPRERKRIVLTSIEHKSVLEPCRWLSAKGFDVVEIPVTRDGVADMDAARHLIDENTLLVCVHGANNEMGTLQPVAAMAAIAHANGALVHCDASQMLGKVPVSMDDLGVDFASFSGHKVYGPKGVGALFVRQGSARSLIASPYRGGSHEGRLRPGTLNVPGIVGFGEACRLVQEKIKHDVVILKRLRCAFEHAIMQTLPNARINGCRFDRLPGTSSVTISGVPASMLMANVPHICISDGSACNSGAPEPSHVLLALGLSRDDADCTVRVSFGRGNSAAEAEEAVALIAGAATLLRSRMRETAIPKT